MLFNSLVFAGFFVVVYGLYVALARRVRPQNLLLLAASCLFYGYWDYRFLGLLALSCVVDYQVGRALGRTEDSRKRRVLLVASVSVGLVVLGLFKYLGFFAENARWLLGMLGMRADQPSLDLILPVGISFYTFQTMGYVIDVYRRRLEPSQDFLEFCLFVSFFPQLVAGPIVRGATLLPQIRGPRFLGAEQINAGLYLVLWGYFKKVVVADNLAPLADEVFNNFASHEGTDLLLGTLAFCVQIYGDFSGYTDIARGLGKMMGFELPINFHLPYFASNPRDFWTRWHISLSTWLRDYLYIPLGGSRHGPWRTFLNLMLTMLLGGLWHGAAWNFVAWGGYHGLLLCLHRPWARSSRRRGRLRAWDQLGLAASMLVMFCLTCLGWILFRADSAGAILFFLTHLGPGNHSTFTYNAMDRLMLLCTPLLLVQLAQFRFRDMLIPTRLPFVPRVVFYTLLLVGILTLGNPQGGQFLYFQF